MRSRSSLRRRFPPGLRRERPPAAARRAAAVLLALSLAAPLGGQVVFSEVLFDPEGVNLGQQMVEIRNPGAEPAALGGLWLSFKPAAWQFPAGTSIPPGGALLVHLNRSGTAGPAELYTGTAGMRDLRGEDAISLFRQNLFSDPEKLIDFVQWGGPGQAGESVAVEAGLWTAGEPVDVGTLREGSTIALKDGAPRGASAWCVDGSPTLGGANDDCALSRAMSPVRLNEVRPGPGGLVELVNQGQALEDLEGKSLHTGSAGFRFPAGTLIAPGRFLLVHLGRDGPATEDEVYTGGEFHDLAPEDSIAFFAGSDPSDSTLIVDFLQWGTGGRALEAQAVEAGLWPAGQALALDGLLAGGSLAVRYAGAGPSRWTLDNTPTPGADNRAAPPAAVWINEVLVAPAAGGRQAVEIQNGGMTEVDISGLTLCAPSDAQPGEVVCASLPPGAVIAPRGLLVIELRAEGSPPEEPGIPFPRLDAAGDELALALPADIRNPNNLLDYLRWGGAEAVLMDLAVEAGLWPAGDTIDASALAEGSSIAHQGPGPGAPGYRIDSSPSLGLPNEELPPANSFVRLDCNQDGRVNITDPITIFGIMFQAEPAPPCDDACDSNDDGRKDITDPIYSLGMLFLGLPAKPPTTCGADESQDRLSCVQFDPCGP